MYSDDSDPDDEPHSAESDHDIIYALRTVHQNQTQLLILADQKANVLIGIVAVILTLLFTNAAFLNNLERALLLPLVGFVFIELSALFFALLVIMPKTAGNFNTQRIDEIPNPLFFGYFTKFNQREYVAYITGKMIDNHSAREFLTKDLYQIGLVLKRKYHFLKYAYGLAVLGVFCLVMLSIISVYSKQL